ncbi:hypothetical protein FQA39_LY03027 [Lamprigera yunnana]|nr:hypothetical protein FQA39_LY03027 [Lamprigera yunnana]
MDAPVIVECNASNPLNSQYHSPNLEQNNETTGFPFDDSDFEERDRNSSFRDHLDDIAKRHPEFAEHLNFDKKFPFRSNTWGHRRRSGDSPKASQFAEFADSFDRPSSSKFKGKFGFPFSESFNVEPEYFHRESERSKSKEPKEETSKPPQVPSSDRGRKPNPHIPQSSTVDLGQKQEPICENRGQRSMSAPPENRAGQRFVSSINIPMNTESSSDTNTQVPQQTKSNERVIPIHVEGRDEPVIPKNANQTFSQPPPQNERIYTPKSPGFGQWRMADPPYYKGDSFGGESHVDGRPQFFNKGHPQDISNVKQQQTQKPQTPPAQTKLATPPPQQQQQPQPAPPPSGPISQIKCIQKDVLELMGQVQKFNGQPRDKQYLYLDEMLTRNLLKLDNIETEGKENIRNARKEAINCIQKCISILEAKASANEQLRNEVMGVDTKLEVSAVEQEKPLTSLEISGITRSGSENISGQEEVNQDASMNVTESDVPVQTQETEESNAAAEVADAETKVKEETPKNTDNEQTLEEENIPESSQEASEVTEEEKQDEQKVKKKDNSSQ